MSAGKEKLMKDLDFEIGCQAGIGTFDQACEGTGSAFENRKRIEGTIRYMMQHLNHSLQASDLAALANISLSHYFALFKRATGSAPIDFFIRLRMKRACELLETTSLKIKEIADQLGYDDPFYFSKLFKSVNGMAPTDYRKARQDAINRNPQAQAQSESFLKPAWNTLPYGKWSITRSASAVF
jgi:AraC-like DNA-binding protein